MDRKLKIAIIGYGTMGHEIEKLARKAEIEITEIFDIDNPIKADGKYGFDVAIDFSFPAAAPENIKVVASLGKNIVVGTTGWYEHLPEVIDIVKKAGIGCVYSSNYSLGMNIFRKIVAQAAQMIDKVPDYDIIVSEIHHNRKKDFPSGTALTLANVIIENVARKTEILTQLNQGEAVQPQQLEVSSARVGDVAGVHSVIIDSGADTIELTHRAKNRSGLAAGAIIAAERIFGKQGIYDFEELL